jgi:hypothetical protein
MRGADCDADARPPGQAYVTVDKKVDVLAEEAARKARELEEAAIAKAAELEAEAAAGFADATSFENDLSFENPVSEDKEDFKPKANLAKNSSFEQDPKDIEAFDEEAASPSKKGKKKKKKKGAD